MQKSYLKSKEKKVVKGVTHLVYFQQPNTTCTKATHGDSGTLVQDDSFFFSSLVKVSPVGVAKLCLLYLKWEGGLLFLLVDR